MTWTLPTLEGLDGPQRRTAPNGDLSRQLKQALRDIGVPATIGRVVDGPRTVTFELHPEPGVAMRDFTRLRRLDDLKYALEAESVEIQAPIPGRKVVGLTIPNPTPWTVELGNVAPLGRTPLRVGLGLAPDKGPVSLDIAQLPHLAVAGASGSGKSSLLHTILCGLLLTHTPDDLRLLLVDLKRVELGRYRGVPHLLEPTITSTVAAVQALEQLGDEVERRYSLLEAADAQNLAAYNRTYEKLPRILCVIDELGDLMLQAGARVEQAIVRLGQLGRACGVHVIVATQSPHAQILSGLVKANMPGRIALRVASGVHSRVAIDVGGAERLFGMGDALLQDGQSPVLQRFQSAHVNEMVIAGIVEHWKLEALKEGSEEPVVAAAAPLVAEATREPPVERTPLSAPLMRIGAQRVTFTPSGDAAFIGRIAR